MSVKEAKTDIALAKSIATSGAICLGCIILTLFALGVLITSNTTSVSLGYAAFAFSISAVWFAYSFIVELLIYIKND